jgi:hypothetical protein
MRHHEVRAFHILGRAVKGEFNLRFIVLTTVVLFWIVVALISFMLLMRLYYHVKRVRMDKRRKVYEPAIELVLTEAPQADIVEALRPRKSSDMEVVQEVILDSMQPLVGGPFDALQAAAFELGFRDRALKRLKSRSKFKRSQAMEALGIMRAKDAIGQIGKIIPDQTLDMKLVALRALALIGDPSALPLLLDTADSLPPAMLPRLASLMLEFEGSAAPYIKKLIDSHSASFPPRILKLLLAQAAATEAVE